MKFQIWNDVWQNILKKLLPWIGSPSGDDCFFGSGYSRVAEDSFEHRDAAADDDVVRDVLHDRSGLAGHQGQQDRSLVQVPEQEELSSVEEILSNVNLWFDDTQLSNFKIPILTINST